MTSDQTTRIDPDPGDDATVPGVSNDGTAPGVSNDGTPPGVSNDTTSPGSRWRSIAIGVVVALALLAFVLWWFQPQALFIDDVVDEAFPVAGTDGENGDASDLPATDEPTDGPGDEAGGQPAEAADDPTDDDDGLGDAVDDATATGPSEPVALRTGTFSSRNRYEVTGTATVFALDDAERILRLEDFESTNGPDLFVYLTAADGSADDAAFDTDFVDLGVLTGNIGNQNYVIPADVDLDVHDTVVIWCRRFTSSFGVADLVPVGG